MKKRIIAISLAVLSLSGLIACNGKKPVAEPETSVSSTAFSTSATAITVKPSTTVAETSEVRTEAATTTVPTTTLPITTTAPTTTRVTTTVPQFDENKPEGYYEIIERTFREDLKYGVYRRRKEKNYIETLTDGRQFLVKKDFDEYYIRINYRADYEDLLPSAKENMENFSDMINAELEIINSMRAAKGIAPLKLSNNLTEIACARAEEIAWSGEHSHTRPNGRRFTTILKEAGIKEGVAGENIGWGYATVNDVCTAWKESISHYENIMNPDFEKIGIGIAADPDPTRNLCWTQIFM